MWQAKSTFEPTESVLKLGFSNEIGPLSYRDFLRLLRDDATFREFFNQQLAATPFTAFRWETPAATAVAVDRPFECVVVDCPWLSAAPDRRAFARQFKGRSADDIAVFANLGNDAVMIVPHPAAPDDAYGHLAAFVRRAPDRQRNALWQRVGQEMLNRLGPQPIWLNTAGAGVAWLHIRLDSRPKYYSHAPYRAVAT